jgi:outer membrane protein
MKSYRSWLSGAAVLLVLMFAASLAFAAEKTGFVNIAEVLAKSDAGKKAEEQFKKLVEKDRAAIQDKEKELQKLKDELEKQRPLLKEDVLKARELDYQKRYRDYQLLVKDANEELQAKQQEIMKQLVPEVMKIVMSIGEKENFSMIVDLAVVPMAYHNKDNEITQRVIEEYNRTQTGKASSDKTPAGKAPAGKTTKKKK